MKYKVGLTVILSLDIEASSEAEAERKFYEVYGKMNIGSFEYEDGEYFIASAEFPKDMDFAGFSAEEKADFEKWYELSDAIVKIVEENSDGRIYEVSDPIDTYTYDSIDSLMEEIRYTLETWEKLGIIDSDGNILLTNVNRLN